MAGRTSWTLSVDGFDIERVELTEQGWLVWARSTRNEHRCPTCDHVTRRVHSYTQRRLRDLSVDGQPVRLQLTVGRWRCQNARCPRKTFVERIDRLAGLHQQLTKRCEEALRAIGLALNGEGGSRLARRLHLPASGDTILRIVRRTPLMPRPTPRVVGVDDWAKKKRLRYGTILVDLEAHRVVELLDERTAAVVADWLKQHTGVEWVTRDRSTEYAKGISAGAPESRQVADRWHLLHNLSEALERCLQRLRPDLETMMVTQAVQELSPYDRSKRRSRAEDMAARTARERRRHLYTQVQRLKQQGLNILQIARRLGHTWTCVRDLYQAETCPERKPHPRQYSTVDPYTAYLAQRWQEGCHNAQQLWREIRQRGFRGSHRMVTLWAQARRDSTVPITGQADSHSETQGSASSQQHARLRVLPSSHEWVWKALEKNPTHDSDQRQYQEILDHHPVIRTAVTLAQQFAGLVRNGKPRQLKGWIRRATASGIAEMASFASGIQRDFEAVHAALATQLSNAQCEGQINRLKLIKRMMYGRAKLDLLRVRCLNPV